MVYWERNLTIATFRNFFLKICRICDDHRDEHYIILDDHVYFLCRASKTPFLKGSPIQQWMANYTQNWSFCTSIKPWEAFWGT